MKIELKNGCAQAGKLKTNRSHFHLVIQEIVAGRSASDVALAGLRTLLGPEAARDGVAQLRSAPVRFAFTLMEIDVRNGCSQAGSWK